MAKLKRLKTYIYIYILPVIFFTQKKKKKTKTKTQTLRSSHFILRRLLIALPPRQELLIKPEEDPHKQLEGSFTSGKEHALQNGVKGCLDRWWKRQIGYMVFHLFDELMEKKLG